MLPYEKTAFVWSISFVIFAVGVSSSSDVVGLSTNQNSLDSSSIESIKTVGDVSSGKLVESNANACQSNKECQNGGSCELDDYEYDNGLRHCQCRNGTSGDRCEVVDECTKKPWKCGEEGNVQCIYNISKEIAECKCSNAAEDFDSYTKRCRVQCDSWRDCPSYMVCSKNKDSDLKFCYCPFGRRGDRCLEEIDECKAIGLDCGNNPNVTCLLSSRTGNAVCYCKGWNLAFDEKTKDCIECDCGIRNSLGCEYLPGGEKFCRCLSNYYQRDGKCEACNCGDLSLGCKWENGTKVCNCGKSSTLSNGTCVACNCGLNSHGCSFQNEEKSCLCNQGYIESNGTCRKMCREWTSVDCTNGGKCKNSLCQCLRGTHGDSCEIVDGCYDSWYAARKCGFKDDVTCAFNQTSGTPFCQCKKANYLFDDYDKKCKECDCGTHGICSFYAGKKICKCEKGYAERPKSWYDTNQCERCDCGMYSTGCRYLTYYKKACSCEPGYNEVDGECLECTCEPNGYCSSDGFGNRVCNCYNGFEEKDGNCVPCDCGSFGRCGWNDIGKKICRCKEGYGEKDGKCTECSCYWNYAKANCTFTDGEEKCLCPKGYEERNSYECSDIDECEDRNICPFNTECWNTPGSYDCKCKTGFRPYDSFDEEDTKRYGCQDIDECEEQNECPYRDTSICINTQGSYYCECKLGYYTTFSSKTIEFEGCKVDQRNWKTGTIVIILGFCFISIGLIFAICKRRCSS